MTNIGLADAAAIPPAEYAQRSPQAIGIVLATYANWVLEADDRRAGGV
jgi:hypothetical protein